jgi:hypothetical protein
MTQYFNLSKRPNASLDRRKLQNSTSLPITSMVWTAFESFESGAMLLSLSSSRVDEQILKTQSL